jgi:hypothetical protein
VVEAEAENLSGLYLAKAHEEDMVGTPAPEKMLTGQDQLILVYRHDQVPLLLPILFRGRKAHLACCYTQASLAALAT